MSHLKAKHKIYAKGISNFNDVNLYLVDKNREDSVKLSFEILSDSLKFSIPYDFLSQAPREDRKNAYLNVMINGRPHYLLNELKKSKIYPVYDKDYSWVKDEIKEIPPIEFRIYNTTAHIDSVQITKNPKNNACKSKTAVRIYAFGGFFSFINAADRVPTNTDLVLRHSDGGVYVNYDFCKKTGQSQGINHALKPDLKSGNEDGLPPLF